MFYSRSFHILFSNDKDPENIDKHLFKAKYKMVCQIYFILLILSVCKPFYIKRKSELINSSLG